MTELGLLGMQVARVILVLRHLDWNALHNLKTITFEAFDFARIVCQQADFSDPQILQDLGPMP